LVADWWAARSTSDGQAGVIIAARVADVENLNASARVRLAAAGELTGPSLTTAAGREFQAGDGTVVQLSGGYLDAGHLAHGYAITAHKAQGMTADRAWVLGSDAAYREWDYVASSRGRYANHLYVVDAGDGADEELHAHGAAVTAEPLAGFARALGRSRGKQLGMDQAHPDALDALRSRQTSQQRRALAEAHQQALSGLHDARERQRQARNALAALQGPLQRLRSGRRNAAQRELQAATSLVNEHTATVQRLDDARAALRQQELQALWDKTTRHHDLEAVPERAAGIGPTRADDAPDLGLAL
ncbi:MAG: hypothetical protein M3276_08985, partial [Actinomycetota bacterium]|nr:hypothetical protein [Actinomycetota bacterium]